MWVLIAFPRLDPDLDTLASSILADSAGCVGNRYELGGFILLLLHENLLISIHLTLIE